MPEAQKNARMESYALDDDLQAGVMADASIRAKRPPENWKNHRNRYVRGLMSKFKIWAWWRGQGGLIGGVHRIAAPQA